MVFISRNSPSNTVLAGDVIVDVNVMSSNVNVVPVILGLIVRGLAGVPFPLIVSSVDTSER